MGTVYIFRGKAATGKTSLTDMLAQEFGMPVFRKDDITDAMKSSQRIDAGSINNEVVYNILRQLIQTNLNLGADMILDIGLGNRKDAQYFLDRLDFKGNRVQMFFVDCSDEAQWKDRHLKRLQNPLPHESFVSFEQVKEHYANENIGPFADEYVIDNTGTLQQSYDRMKKIIGR